jgi:polar amino acid transport system ATP-binding protein
MTALENIIEAPVHVRAVPKAEAVETARGLLARVGLADKADNYPVQLSGGQQQRVAIARALAMAPQLMLFDEPTSALDPEMVNEVLEVIRGLARDGMTMVIVTHEIGFAASIGSKIAFLDKGRVLLQGEPKAVFGKPRHARIEQFLDTYLDRGAAMLI